MGTRDYADVRAFLADFIRYVRSYVYSGADMALSNKQRQKRWRKRHPEKAAVHFDGFKIQKARAKLAKTAPTKCEHEGRLAQVTVFSCGTCGEVVLVGPLQWS